MKTFKCPIFLILLLSFFHFHAQSQTPSIAGIGALKIGNTISDIIPPVEKDLGKVKKVKNSNDIKEGKIGELTEHPRCDGYREFHIPVYTVAGIKLKDIELDFFQDTLYQIVLSGDYALYHALEVKYGSPKSSTKIRQFQCTTSLGTSFDLPEKVTDYIWGSGTTITGDYYETEEHDRQTCEISKSAIFILHNDKTTEIVNKCERDAYNSSGAREQEKKKLEGF